MSIDDAISEALELADRRIALLTAERDDLRRQVHFARVAKNVFAAADDAAAKRIAELEAALAAAKSAPTLHPTGDHECRYERYLREIAALLALPDDEGVCDSLAPHEIPAAVRDRLESAAVIRDWYENASARVKELEKQRQDRTLHERTIDANLNRKEYARTRALSFLSAAVTALNEGAP